MNDNSLPLDTASQSGGSIANTFNFTPLTNITEQFGEFYRSTVLRSTSALEHIVWFTLLYTAICLIAYRVIFQKWAKRYRQPVQFPQCKRALIVTAHPDDECMFFGPTILSLTQRTDCHVYLLCLSNGKPWPRPKFRNLIYTLLFVVGSDEEWVCCSWKVDKKE